MAKPFAANHSTADVTVATTTETVAITSDPIKPRTRNPRYFIIAWCQLLVGTGTTAITPRLRRGSSTGDPLVGEGNAEAVKGAAGSRGPVMAVAIDTPVGLSDVVYSLTVQQTAATANGTVQQAGIIVIEL